MDGNAGMIEWKDIKGFEGLYKISNTGKVWSVRRKKEVATAIALNGYEHLTLHKNGVRTNKMIHRLVAEAFIPNPENKNTVNHKDENKLNNNVDNLEWMTEKENSNHGTRTERSMLKRRVSVYLLETDTTYPSITEAERKTGISASTIVNNLRLNNDMKRKWHFSLA